MRPSAKRIWQNPNEIQMASTEEFAMTLREGRFIDDRFIDTLTNLVVEILDVSFGDRNIVARCFKSALKEDVENYLEAYLNGNLEVLAKTINRTFGIDEKVDYRYAVHSKFNTIIKKIQSLIGTANDSGK